MKQTTPKTYLRSRFFFILALICLLFLLLVSQGAALAYGYIDESARELFVNNREGNNDDLLVIDYSFGSFSESQITAIDNFINSNSKQLQTKHRVFTVTV